MKFTDLARPILVTFTAVCLVAALSLVMLARSPCGRGISLGRSVDAHSASAPRNSTRSARNPVSERCAP